MAAGKDQSQTVVLKALLFVGSFRRTRLRFEIAREVVLRGIKSRPASQGIDGFEARGRNQPWSRARGCPTVWPRAHRSREGLVHRFFARSKSPSKRIRVARIRPESSR